MRNCLGVLGSPEKGLNCIIFQYSLATLRIDTDWLNAVITHTFLMCVYLIMVDINNCPFHPSEDKNYKSFTTRYDINPPARVGISCHSWFAILILVFMRKCFSLPSGVQLVSTLLPGSLLLMNPSAKTIDAIKYSFLEPVLTLIEVGGGPLTPRNSSSLFKNVRHVWGGGGGAAFSNRALSWKGASESSISDTLWSLNRNSVVRKFSNFLCNILNSQKGEFIFSKQSYN